MPQTSENIIGKISEIFGKGEAETLLKQLAPMIFDQFVDKTLYEDARFDSAESMAQVGLTTQSNLETAKSKAQDEAEKVVRDLKNFSQAYDGFKASLIIAESMNSRHQQRIRDRIERIIVSVDDYLNSLEPEIRAIVYSLAEIDTITVEAPSAVVQVIGQIAARAEAPIDAPSQAPARKEPEQTPLNLMQHKLLEILTQGDSSNIKNRLALALSTPQKRLLLSFLERNTLPAGHLTHGELQKLSGADSGNVVRMMNSMVTKLTRLGLDQYFSISDRLVEEGKRMVRHWKFTMSDSIPDDAVATAKQMIETQIELFAPHKSTVLQTTEMSEVMYQNDTIQKVIDALVDKRQSASKTVLELFRDRKIKLNHAFGSVDLAKALGIKKFNNYKRTMEVLKRALNALPAPLNGVLVLKDIEQDAPSTSSPKQYMLVFQPSAEAVTAVQPVRNEATTTILSLHDSFTTLLGSLDISDDEKAALQLTEEVVAKTNDIGLYVAFYILVRAKAIIPSFVTIQHGIGQWVVEKSDGKRQLLEIMRANNIQIPSIDTNFDKLCDDLHNLLQQNDFVFQIARSSLGLSICSQSYLNQRNEALRELGDGIVAEVSPERHLALSEPNAAAFEGGFESEKK